MVAARLLPTTTASSPARPTLWLLGDTDLRETHAQVSAAALTGAEDAVTAWRRTIAGYPLLSAADERRLALRMRGGPVDSVTAKAARQRLWESGVRWSYQLATWYATARVPLEDLAQVAALALWNALPNYDPAKGRLTTYAAPYIIRDLRRAVDEYASLIHRPAYVLTRERRVFRVAAQHEAEHGVAPSLALMAAALDVPPEVAEDVLAQVERTRAVPVGSLDRTHAAADGRHSYRGADAPFTGSGSLADALADEDAASDPEQVAERHDRQARIAQAIDKLLPVTGVSTETARTHTQMRRVLILFYAGGRKYEGKQIEIAKFLGISRERVRQVHQAALLKLRQKAATTAGRELMALWLES